MMSRAIFILACFAFASIFAQSSFAYNKMQEYMTQYKYSHLALQSLAFWWTPDVENKKLHVALAGAMPGYVAFGFNNMTGPRMLDGFGVVAENTKTPTVTLYNLGDYKPVKLDDQSNIKNWTFSSIENHLFFEFVWDLSNGSCTFSFNSSETYFLFAVKAEASVFLEQHDDKIATKLNLTTGEGAKPLKFCAGCVYGTQDLFQCPCDCIGNFQPPNCEINGHKFNYTFMTASGDSIATIYWTFNDIEASFDVVGDNAKGWVSVGFSQDLEGSMIGTDAVGAPWNDRVSSYHLTQIPPSFDPDHGSNINVSSTSYWRFNNTVAFSFTRTLLSGHNLLRNPEEVYMVAAKSSLNPNPTPLIHNGRTPGASSVNLVTGVVDGPVFAWNTQATHGLLMYIAWVILIPIAYVWARYAKNYKKQSGFWFEVHRLLNTIGFLITISAFAIALIMVPAGKHFTNWHQITGLAVFVAMLLQVSSGILRPHAGEAGHKSGARLAFEIFHHLIGRLTILTAWAAIFGGLLIMAGDYPVSPNWIYVHAAIISVWVIINVLLEARLYTGRRRDYTKVNGK